MNTDPRRTMLWSIGLFAGPIVLVKVAGYILGGGPAPSIASDVDQTPHPTAIVVPQIAPATEAQRTAAAYARIIGAQRDLESPFDYQPKVDQADRPIVANDDPQLPAPPTIDVQAVIGGRVPTALIDGVLYVAGDPIAETWQVVEIDVQNSQVVLREPGTQRELRARVRDRAGDHDARMRPADLRHGPNSGIGSPIRLMRPPTETGPLGPSGGGALPGPADLPTPGDANGQPR